MLICITCQKFERRDTTNQRLYLGRCDFDDIAVMICKRDDCLSEACDNYSVAPDAKERIAHYKAWKELHPTPVYAIAAGTQVGKDERAKPARKPRGKRKK